MFLIIILILFFLFLIMYQLFFERPRKTGFIIEGMETTDDTTTDPATDSQITTLNNEITDLTNRVTTLEQEVGQMTQQITDLVQQQADFATQLAGSTPPDITGTDMSE